MMQKVAVIQISEAGSKIASTLTKQLGARAIQRTDAHELHFPYITLGVMLGKAVKLAAGHLDTHSRKATMDKTFISGMLKEADCDIDISDITLARELWDRLPADKKSAFARIVISHCAEHCCPLLPNGQLTILLIDDEGHIWGDFL